MLQIAFDQDMIEAPGNRLSEFIAEWKRIPKHPLSTNILQKSFFRGFILTPPTTVEFEEPHDFRAEEQENLSR